MKKVNILFCSIVFLILPLLLPAAGDDFVFYGLHYRSHRFGDRQCS